MGIWKDTGSTRLQNLAVRSILVFNSTLNGNKLVGIHNRTGMEFAIKFNGTLVGMLSVTSPTNTQKDDLHAAAVPSPTLMGLLSNTGSCVGPVWGAVPAV
eukprot:835825-Pelagomonas_calceolata.AAC.1